MKASILCIDDDIQSLRALKRVLGTRFDVTTATNAELAIDLMKAQPFNAIITDQSMPNMKGLEFLKRSQKIQPEASRLLLTGRVDKETLIPAMENGDLDVYLSKPWDNYELLALVNQAVRLNTLRLNLRKSQSELENFDRAKTQFMVLVNHELKTPLTGLSGFLELLSETELNEEQQLYADRIRNCADKMGKIISEVLQFSTAQNKEVEIRPQPLSGKKQIENVIQNFQESAKLKGLNFVVETDNKDDIVADVEVVESVLRRLTDNAIKFGEKGTAVKFRLSSNDEDKVTFSIENSGSTMDDKTLDAIKRPFNLNENILNHSKGLGLGLSVCDALLHLHDSELRINSEDDNFEVQFDLPSASRTDSGRNV